jgi:ADP-heptose:LPS heptosyltransferase
MKKIFKAIINAVLACFVPRRCGSMPEHPARIGVVMCHWLGDTFWASQTIPYLKRRFPDAEIHLFLRLDFSDLFYNLVAPEHIHLVPEVISDRKRECFSWLKLTAAARQYRPLNFGLVVDLTGNRYSALFTRLLKPEYSIGFEGDEFGSLYSRLVGNSGYADLHLWQRLFKVMSAAVPGMELPDLPRPPLLKQSFEQACGAIGLDSALPLAVIAPCAGWPEKEWGDANFALLAAALKAEGYQVVISGTAKELPRGMKIAGKSGAIAWSGELGLLCSLLSGAKLFVGNDSGVGHIAASFDEVRVVTIFTGSTFPERLAPAGRKVSVLHSVNNDIAVNNVLSCCRTK